MPPSAPTRAQMGGVVDDDIMMMLSDVDVDALYGLDEDLQQWYRDDGVVGVDYEGSVLDFDVGK